MDARKLKKSNHALVVLTAGLIVFAVASGAGSPPTDSLSRPATMAVLGAAVTVFISYMVAFEAYLSAKGYPGEAALFLLIIPFVGIVIALLLPDRNKERERVPAPERVQRAAFSAVRLALFCVGPLAIFAFKAATAV